MSAELRNVVHDQFAPVRAAIDELEPCVGCAPRSSLFASVRARINALEECVLEVALTASHALRGMEPPSFQMTEASQVPRAENVQAIEVTLTIDVGQSRARLFDARLPYPKTFFYTDEIRTIDIECLKITGKQRTEVTVVRGDMPQTVFSQWPHDHDSPPQGTVLCCGMAVPARQSWDVYASVFPALVTDEPTTVTLRITQCIGLDSTGRAVENRPTKANVHYARTDETLLGGQETGAGLAPEEPKTLEELRRRANDLRAARRVAKEIVRAHAAKKEDNHDPT